MGPDYSPLLHDLENSTATFEYRYRQWKKYNKNYNYTEAPAKPSNLSLPINNNPLLMRTVPSLSPFQGPSPPFRH